MIRYLLIILFSLFFSFYSFEFYLNYTESVPLNKKIKIYEELTKNKFDTRDKIEVYIDLKKEHPNLTSTIVPKWYAIHQQGDILPLSGLSNSLTLHCNENGYFSKFKSDRYGFNNPDDQWDKDEIEFLIVGDSFAMGECVNRPYDFGSVLRDISNKSSLNLGYSSNGPNIQYAVLREYLDNRVNNVLWMYYEGNDLTDMMGTLKSSKILNKYLNDLDFSQELKLKQAQLDKLNKIHIKEQLDYHNEREIRKEKYKLLRFIRLDKTKNILKKIFKPDEEQILNDSVYINFKNVLNLSQELVKKNGSKFYFIYLPSFYRLHGQITNEQNNQKNKVISVIKELGIEYIDIEREILLNNEDYLDLFPFGMYGHYSVNGYRIVSNIIYNNIYNKNK